MDQRLPEAAVTDWRGLCEELAREVQQYALEWDDEFPKCLVRARAALAAEPVAEGPSLEEVEDLCEEHCFNVEGYESIECLQGLINDAIARYGHQPAPPVEGEVGELIQWLRSRAGIPASPDFPAVAARLTRAADLLEQLSTAQDLQPVPDCERNWDSILSPSGGYEMTEDAALRDGSQQVNGEWWAPVFGCDSLESALVRIRERLQRQAAPVPVAVSERLPGPEDCDAEGRVWGTAELGGWRLVHHSKIGLWRAWLPATALPLPSGEVQP